MSHLNETTPLTEMLGLYRQLSSSGSSTLTRHLGLATEFAKRPDEIAARFALSVAQFSRYRNPDQAFHDGNPYASIPDEPPAEIVRTHHFAAHLSGRRWEVAGHPELGFLYVDREPDCMRTSPGQPLEDGAPSKNQITADLLLRDAHAGIPIVSELKIGRDENAFYGLVQALAAAAHLVTPSQRLRLHKIYGYPLATTGGPYLDVYVILFRHPMKGKRPKVLALAKEIRDALLVSAITSSLVRRIEFLHSDLTEHGLTFEVA